MVASPRREGPLDEPGDPFWGVPRPRAAAVVRAVSGCWRCPGAISADEEARTHLVYRATRKVGTMAGTATLNRGSGRRRKFTAAPRRAPTHGVASTEVDLAAE